MGVHPGGVRSFVFAAAANGVGTLVAALVIVSFGSLSGVITGVPIGYLVGTWAVLAASVVVLAGSLWAAVVSNRMYLEDRQKDARMATSVIGSSRRG